MGGRVELSPRSPPKSPNLEFTQPLRPSNPPSWKFDESFLPATDESSRLLYEQIPASIDIPSVIKALNINPEQGRDFVLLDSERCLRPELGVHSTIGLISPQTLRVKYKVGCKSVRLLQGSSVAEYQLNDSPTAIFTFLKVLMDRRKLGRHAGPPESPFWGGLVGYVSYEAGLETLGLSPGLEREDDTGAPDVCFAFIERSVVTNHSTKTTFIQSTAADDRRWLEDTAGLLRETVVESDSRKGSQNGARPVTSRQDMQLPSQTHIKLPIRQDYEEKIRRCLRYIENGDSYELCLTDQTVITVDNARPGSQWATYMRLRNSNPAPFGAYLRLDDMTVLFFFSGTVSFMDKIRSVWE